MKNSIIHWLACFQEKEGEGEEEEEEEGEEEEETGNEVGSSYRGRLVSDNMEKIRVVLLHSLACESMSVDKKFTVTLEPNVF